VDNPGFEFPCTGGTPERRRIHDRQPPSGVYELSTRPHAGEVNVAFGSYNPVRSGSLLLEVYCHAMAAPGNEGVRLSAFDKANVLRRYQGNRTFAYGGYTTVAPSPR
jgi:hypothetical protein